jgi:thiamine biosynthesis protein ThiI
MFVIHYGEIGIKGHNRDRFEQKLLSNIQSRLRDLGGIKVSQRHGSLLVDNGSVPGDEVRNRLKWISGIEYYNECVKVPSEPQAILNVSVDEMKGLSGTFRVTARRADKRFPWTSQLLAAEAGEAVLKSNSNLTVDLHKPEHTLWVEVGMDGAYVSRRKERGIGGLPVGSGSKLLSLISGGIDSPVASWMMLKRGAPLHYVSFHNFPYTDRASIDVVKDIVTHLNRNAGKASLSLINLTPIQQEIAAVCEPRYRVLLYRRMMFRIAERLAEREGCFGYVTGESLGQVASQTIENIATVNAVATRPILRPLIGHDKQEIVDIAIKIGTYELSIRPHGDCCSLFLPENPATRSQEKLVAADEAKLDIEKLITEALAKEEVSELSEIKW